jgi:hypothetical protein
MKKIIAFFPLFFLVVCIFGQSQDTEIERFKQAVIAHSGKILEDTFNIFAKNSTISYELSSVKHADDRYYRNIDITIKNEFGKADFIYCINLPSLGATLEMVVINQSFFWIDRFGLPTNVPAFAEYMDWIYNTLNDG